MKTFKIVANHFKREKVHYLLSVIGLSCAIMTAFLFSMVRTYYDDSIDDIYPSSDEVLIVTENGIPFYHVVPYGSRLNASIKNDIDDYTGVLRAIPAIFLKASDVENVSAFSDLIMGVPVTEIDSIPLFLRDSLLLDGRYPDAGKKEVTIGVEVGNGSYGVHDLISIDNDDYEVVGILKPSSIIFDHVMICDLNVVQAQFSLTGFVTCIFVHFNSSETTTDALKNTITGNHNDTQVVTHDDIEELASIFLLISSLSEVLFGTFITLISILFMFMLMIKKFQNNSQEIKTLHVLGTPFSSIARNYFVEALALAILGFGIGILGGFTIYFGLLMPVPEDLGAFWTLLGVAIENVEPGLVFNMFLFSIASTLVSLLYPLQKIIKSEKIVQLKLGNLFKSRKKRS
ncbi:MAG: FtsX-like permease family protein [Candidatus Hodarchaeota archaeon]